MTKQVEELHSDLDALSERVRGLLEEAGVDTSAGGRLDKRVGELMGSGAADSYADALALVGSEDPDAAWEYIAQRQEETGGRAMAPHSEHAEVAPFSEIADRDLRVRLTQWWRCRERGDQAAANSLYDALRRSYGDAVDLAIRGGG